jgi:predicted glycogen debranching enzyme
MSYLNFEKSELVNLEYSLNRELLRSNRAGSYSSSTIIFCNTRKYHGLLVCPMEHLDGDKHVLLSTLDLTIIQGTSEFNLGIHKYQGDLYNPKGHKYVQDFQVGRVMQIYYRVGGVRILRESLLIEKEQQNIIRYTVLEVDKATKLKFTPFLAFRSVHHLSKANLHAQTKVKFIPGGIKTKLYDGYPFLHIQFSKPAEFVPTPDWYYDIEYLEEQRRGYEYKEDLFVPGFFETPVRKGETIYFSASTVEANPANLQRKFTAEYNKRIERRNFKDCLTNSAEQFFVRRDKKTEITAGFHWYGVLARSTFLSLPGLTLPIGDRKTFKSVCDTMVSRLDHGFFSDTGTEEPIRQYAADTALWFIWDLQRYCIQTNECAFIWKNYGNALKSIIRQYSEGTEYNIKMMKNGLIYAGSPGEALTWMNSIVMGKPVTPRTGMAVEVNALWYNALVFCAEIAEKAGESAAAKRWKNLSEKIKKEFINTFWDDRKRYLADFVDGENKDWAVRPNQVIAASLPFTPLTPEMKKDVLEIVKRDLLTTRGLRTLAPDHPDYKGKYEGDADARDLANHQGTVWPWLIEHYCEGYLNLYKKSGLSHVKSIIRDFESTVSEHGIGSISEIYDGDPSFVARGAISFAPSVAALLSVIDKVEKMEIADEKTSLTL